MMQRKCIGDMALRFIRAVPVEHMAARLLHSCSSLVT